MPLDTRIALSAQPIQLENPLAQYGQFMSAIHAGTQNQLAMQQVSAAQRAAEEEEGLKNYLANPKTDLSTAEGQRGAMQFGAKGQALLKNVAERKKTGLESDKLGEDQIITRQVDLQAANILGRKGSDEKFRRF